MQDSNKPFTVLLENELVPMTFDQMYKKYRRSVYYMISKQLKGDEMVSEELTNDVFIKVLKCIDQYNIEFAISTWIFSIAKNLVIDYVRKKTLPTVWLDSIYQNTDGDEKSSSLDRYSVFADHSENPEQKMISNELRRSMYLKYETLNEQEKVVAALHFFDGLSYDEVAQQLNMPLGTVKAKLHRARTRLMEAFPQEMRKV